MIRRTFSTLSSKHPSFLSSIKGEVVSYPKNAVNVYGERPIVAVGVEAVQMIDETHPADALRNKAKVNYLIQREKLLSNYKGYWLVTSSNKSICLVEHEAVAEAIGEQMFRSKTEDYYIGCIGSEVISQALMGNVSLADQDQED
eukprot:gene25596-28921_t